MSNEVSNARELNYLHQELALIYRSGSTDVALVAWYWRKIDYLEELVGGES